MPFLLNAQYQIKLKAQNTKDTLAYFRGVMFDNKNYIPKDTLDLRTGFVKSSALKPIIGGIYYFQFAPSRERVYFILENKDTLSFEINGPDYLNNIKTSSKKNQIFLAYQRLEKKYAGIDSTYSQQLAAGKKFNLAQKDAFFKIKRDTLMAFRKNALKSLKSTDLLYLHFTTLNKLDEFLPERKNINSRNEFIRQFDFNNPKLLFTPDIEEVLYEYMSAFPIHGDSLSRGMDTVLLKIDCKTKALTFVFEYFAKLLRNRNVQNNTEGFTHLIERYIKNGSCAYANENKAKEYLKQLDSYKALTLKDTSLNLLLADTSGTTQNLHAFAKNFDYTVICFYSPTCEHCQVEMPLMDSTISILEKRLNLSIGKFAVCNDPGTSKKSWTEFINKYNLTSNYLHVEMNMDVKYRDAYDAYSTPLFYLIDRDGILEAKKISPVTLRKYFATKTKAPAQ